MLKQAEMIVTCRENLLPELNEHLCTLKLRSEEEGRMQECLDMACDACEEYIGVEFAYFANTNQTLPLAIKSGVLAVAGYLYITMIDNVELALDITQANLLWEPYRNLLKGIQCDNIAAE